MGYLLAGLVIGPHSPPFSLIVDTDHITQLSHVGLVFLMFLPFIGFYLFANAIVKKLSGGVKRSAKELASTVSPGWAPGEAHLTGKAGEKKEDGAATPELEKLEKEIAARKEEKK